MKKLSLLVALLLFCVSAQAQVFDSLTLINSANWARFFNDMLGYQYESRGNVHFYPSDIYLLYRTIAPGTVLKIKPYKLEAGDPPFQVSRIPYFADITNSEDDIQKHLGVFKSAYTEMVLYPSLNLLFIYSGGGPYAKLAVQCGEPSEYLAALEVKPGQPTKWDFTLARPTEPGSFEIYGITSRYVSGSYYKDTVIPFGAWLRKVNGVWCYQENDWWYRLPDYIASDLEKAPVQRQFKYYDVDPAIPAARWAGNDFGSYVMLWTKNGYRASQMGYAPGELLYEQAILVKDMVRFLTSDSMNIFKLEITSSEAETDPRVLKAYGEFTENRLPRDREARRRALGLYYYLKQNDLSFKNQLDWVTKIKKNWQFLLEIKSKLDGDFNRMGVLSIENRQNILEDWLTERLEFGRAVPPSEAKNLSELAFNTFFKPEEKPTVFDEREGAIMRQVIRRALSGEAVGLELESVKALNNYNFGRLLNEILGDLYKSHGCLHVSPRSSYFLYTILPLGARMNVHKYSENISPEAMSGIPLLADLVNFPEDLDKLKEQLSSAADIRIEVYPSSGYWILYLKDKPFTYVSVKGGPTAPFNLMEGREANGKPQFQDALAYPTTPGKYYIFRKVTDYFSNLYRDATLIPMGGIIRRSGEGWVFQDKEGKWQSLPDSVAADLNRPPEARGSTYYDPVKNASDEVVEVKWGSQPFGKYAIQTSVNNKTPFPELIHSSGDLIMEERQIISDLIALLSLPYDKLEDCVDYDPNFATYKNCADFVADPSSGEAIGLKERAYYKLYYQYPLSTEEAAVLPQDVLAVTRIMHGAKPTSAELKLLLDEGMAAKKKGTIVVNRQKLYGMNFDIYQYGVAIKKYANHYTVLKNHWDELNGLRWAMLKDFNNFVIKDPSLFHSFMRELMLSRTRLEKITQEKAFRILDQLIEQPPR